jgi:hypothetical protein
MGKLLLDSYPLVVIPELAVAIGLNEALVIQQVHYWTEINRKADRNRYVGDYWTYNTYEEWQGNFPFWSVSTIRRIITGLERKELIITGNFNKMSMDRTKWYRINYDKLEEISSMCSNWTAPCVQNEQMQVTNMNRAIPETNTEISLPKNDQRISVDQSNDRSSHKETIFSRVKDTYAKNDIDLCYDIVNQYIDSVYNAKTGFTHIEMTSPMRMAFAEKLLKFKADFLMNEKELLDFLNYIIDNHDYKKIPAQLPYINTPTVLGYWLLDHPDYGFDVVRDTEYQPVENYYA